MTEQHLEILFQRLLSHEMKYTDIASKLHVCSCSVTLIDLNLFDNFEQASYDRLKLRHSHALLEAAYKAEVEAHKERKARKRKSNLRKRTEARLEHHAGTGAGHRERGPAAT